MSPSGGQVKRPYDSSGRREAAARTRRKILDAATAQFLQHGYVTTTMAAIARHAGVNADTVYASVGAKPALFRLLIETALSGGDEAVSGAERDYARRMRAEPDPRAKLAIYAAAVRSIHQRLAPLFGVLQAAAHPDLTTLWQEISQRRAANMRLVAADLGPLRVEQDEAADVLWATNSAELYLMLTRERGWTPDHYERWLTDTWTRLLLPPEAPH
ncbi:TetR/AcrR family transcriptional regulator [Nonomuraea sp. NPDC050536]|uniref:TetR/AcrR family transcriptional regulator n=1 Tax=Nonomuraea sp. NPDC050536 TaxID=3364366 RepID=UPI0037C91D4D